MLKTGGEQVCVGGQGNARFVAGIALLRRPVSVSCDCLHQAGDHCFRSVVHTVRDATIGDDISDRQSLGVIACCIVRLSVIALHVGLMFCFR